MTSFTPHEYAPKVLSYVYTLRLIRSISYSGAGQGRPMGQWSQSLNINGPFLKSMGHWSKLMGQLTRVKLKNLLRGYNKTNRCSNPELVITRGS